MHYVYIIKSEARNWFYVGSTGNISKRLEEHNFGKTKSTKAYTPFTIIYTEELPSKTEARKRENFIKRNHALKKDIINSWLASNT
ncbi:MAG TPA: GIY-YIG nuclease family protein [Patescibacteria group bacterium]|nr:GIY-YIG nuclease family protein [Patescibacteria group bacterium]